MSGRRARRERAARQPAYLGDVLRLGLALGPGVVGAVNVAHGDECAIWSGRPCDCRPTVKLDTYIPPTSAN